MSEWAEIIWYQACKDMDEEFASYSQRCYKSFPAASLSLSPSFFGLSEIRYVVVVVVDDIYPIDQLEQVSLDPL